MQKASPGSSSCWIDSRGFRRKEDCKAALLVYPAPIDAFLSRPWQVQLMRGVLRWSRLLLVFCLCLKGGNQGKRL